jgi:hypothetical protein
MVGLAGLLCSDVLFVQQPVDPDLSEPPPRGVAISVQTPNVCVKMPTKDRLENEEAVIERISRARAVSIRVASMVKDGLVNFLSLTATRMSGS